MSEKSPRIRPHETQWGHSQGLTMDELRLVGDKMYHPLNPDHQRRLGQVSFLEEDPEFFADSMEAKDNPPDATS